MICDNLSVSKEGHLLFAGQDTVELAKKYGTDNSASYINGVLSSFEKSL